MLNDSQKGAVDQVDSHDQVIVLEDPDQPLAGRLTDGHALLLKGKAGPGARNFQSPQSFRAKGNSRHSDWWHDAVIYEVYMRSVADASGDGNGDLRGVTSHIPYLASLGVDVVWLTPFYPSPLADNGYDIKDYYNVDPVFGSLQDFDRLLASAHDHGLKVVIDFVANHTSDEHPWFQEALRSPPGSAARNRYLFRDGRGANFDQPPNDWQSIFGGSAWKRVPNDRQWYFHLFLDKQVDLNWRNPEVHREFDNIIRFWLDRGVDGLRVDAGECLLKRENFSDYGDGLYFADQPHLEDIFHEWRQIVNQYPGRCLIGEIFNTPQGNVSKYVSNDRLNQSFAFDFQQAVWKKSTLLPIMQSWCSWANQTGLAPTWVSSSHDQIRYVTRLGLSEPGAFVNEVNEQPNEQLGVRRARAMICMTAFLPGAMCLYYGEELGLPNNYALRGAMRGARAPMSWKKNAPAFGFSPTGNTWLPQPSSYGEYAADRQEDQDSSVLSFYKYVLRLRREYGLGRGKIQWVDSGNSNVIIAKSGDITMVINMGNTSLRVRTTSKVIVRSSTEPVTNLMFEKPLPANSAIWLKS